LMPLLFAFLALAFLGGLLFFASFCDLLSCVVGRGMNGRSS